VLIFGWQKNWKRTARRRAGTTLCALLAIALSSPSSANLSLHDEQVNIIDYPVSGSLWIWNQSATFIEDGGDIEGWTRLYQLSWLEMNGGSIGYDLAAYTSSEVYLFGGSVDRYLHANGSASIDWSGGQVGSSVVAEDDAIIRIYGTGFTVDAVPVPYGVLAAAEGTLRGTLNDGTTIDLTFFHAGAIWINSVPVTGTIELASGDPIQSPAPDFSDLVALLNDGAVHNVDDDSLDDLPFGVRVRSPEAQTTLNVLPGAEIGYAVTTSENSKLNISGGDIGFRGDSSSNVVGTGGQTEFLMTGGVIHGWSIFWQQTRAEISGGTLTGEIWLEDEAQLLLTGGFLDGGVQTRRLNSHLEMTGGFIFTDLEVNGTALIRGGGIGDELIAQIEGRITIVGSGFEIWGQPVPFGPLADYSGRLTGILESGDPLDVYISRRQFVVNETETLEGQITLLPEPAGTALLVTGIAGLSGLAQIRRRRSLMNGSA
jgi:hypothetical protein